MYSIKIMVGEITLPSLEDEREEVEGGQDVLDSSLGRSASSRVLPSFSSLSVTLFDLPKSMLLLPIQLSYNLISFNALSKKKMQCNELQISEHDECV